MIYALISDLIVTAPQQRTGASEKPFTLLQVSTTDRTSTSHYCTVIAFDHHKHDHLRQLSKVNGVALAGALLVTTATYDHDDTR